MPIKIQHGQLESGLQRYKKNCHDYTNCVSSFLNNMSSAVKYYIILQFCAIGHNANKGQSLKLVKRYNKLQFR